MATKKSANVRVNKKNHINQNVLNINKGKWNNRILIGIPAVGLVRMEWVLGRYGQTIPTNWSNVEILQWMSSHVPLRYQLADAENIFAKAVVEHDFEWFLSIEHDNVLPPDTFIKLNQYMIKGDIPIISSLYFTKSEPPEPMVYREFGKGFYADWKLGDKVWVRGIPFGCTLIHGSIIKALWKESEPYTINPGRPNAVETRKVFKLPDERYSGPDGYLLHSGTSDLAFCKEVVEREIFAKAGWPEFQKKKYPFLVDTGIFVRHIDNSGIQWPTMLPRDFVEGKVKFSSCLTR